MADNKPEWIQGYVWGILLGMKLTSGQNDSYYNAVKTLLTDPDLRPVWDRLNAALSRVDYRLQVDAAAFVIGGICGPVKLYGSTGTADRPAPKRILKQSYKDAQDCLKAASNHLTKAASEIQKAAKTSGILPDETTTIAGMVRDIFVKAGHKDAISLAKIPDNFWYYAKGLKTVVFLEEMAAKLTPDDNPFADIPGMRSNKASWRDWLNEAVANLEKAGDIYGGNFSMGPGDWMPLAKSLIDPDIDYEPVKKALKTTAS